MNLPLLLSVPHAGLDIPPDVQKYCTLTPEHILQDSDEGAGDIYELRSEVDGFVTTPIARAIVDVNRAEDDRRPDGVVKTHTCWNIPVYRVPLPESIIQSLLSNYYLPYHRQLSQAARNVLFGIDCHTMAAVAPPISPDIGQKRPCICLSNADGTCSQLHLERLAGCLEEHFGFPPAINNPFRGGYNIRSHASELPWLQLEFSRAPFLTLHQKRSALLNALTNFCIYL